METARWTLVSVEKGGRIARPIANAPVTDWWGAMEATQAMPVPDGVDVWYVPAQGQQVWPEDQDNILLPSGRRIPIRWDATPKHAFPATA
jgi:hypothetical protein